MGLLKQKDSNEREFSLESFYMEVGRGRGCDLILNETAVSWKHASLSWTLDGWSLRDLNSRNGTWLRPGGQGLTRIDKPSQLRAGDVVVFGSDSQTWELSSDARPLARAVCQETGAQVEEKLDRSGLELSGIGRTVRVRVAEDHWVLEDGSISLAVQDGLEVTAAGCRWQLHLPEVLDRTRTAVSSNAPLRQIVVRLPKAGGITLILKRDAVSLVDGSLCRASGRVELPRRQHLRLLWLLAERPGAWLELEKLLVDLEVNPDQRHVLDNYVHQLRIVFSEIGGLKQHEAKELIQRDRGRIRLAT